MKTLRPDLKAKIYLYPTDKGGRKKEIPAVQFGCPVFFEKEGFDCRLLLDQIGKSIKPGNVLEDVPIKFLYPEKIKPYLKIGSKFKLWEMGYFGEGEITEIVE